MYQLFRAEQVFDGTRLHPNAAIGVGADGYIHALYTDDGCLPADLPVQDLGPGTLAPGFVDLQVNGGGGLLVGAQTDAAQLARICAIHARLGATSILPTLITNAPDVTRTVIAAAITAAGQGVSGFAGLHLEGPHLDPRRKGAHDAALIRPMTQSDLDLLCQAARYLPALMVTVAPEAVSCDQIATLTDAGVIVSIGHSDCDAAAAHQAHLAGASCVTHLYNAMGSLHNRAPNLVGAALVSGLRAGIIADGVHVAADCLLVAARLKAPDQLFLVSDAMATAGTELDGFTLNDRCIYRRDGRLTLADSTLAGADITMPQSVAHMIGLGVDPAVVLAMASRVPAGVISAADCGQLIPGARADFVLLDTSYRLCRVWQSGQPIDLI